MKKNVCAICLLLAMLIGMLAGCGSSTETTEAADTQSEAAEEQSEEVSEEAGAEETAEESEEAETAETEEAAEESGEAETEESEASEESASGYDFTESNAAYDYTGYREMLKTLTTSLPITTEDVTLKVFMGYESSVLNYLPDGTMESHQIWTWLEENTGIDFDLVVVDKTNEATQFDLIITSGEYPDIMPATDYTSIEAGYEDEVFADLSDLIEENMPNYWTIINSDQNVLEKAQDGGKFLAIYAIKDQVANPAGIGTFIRMDWLEDLGMDVPETYDELTEVLQAFKTEKGATEPMSLFKTVSMSNGLLMGGFGSLAELVDDGSGGDVLNAYYQEDGEVVYGATADGTRKFLSWLNELYNEGLINFDNMLNRETNPFSDLNATEAADGSTGYIFSNQPFGGNYSTMAASQYDDTECNWWPVQDVAEEAGQQINFYEEVDLIDVYATTLAISTQCENLEVAMQFLDYGYSYEGGLLYNYGFEIGSGHDVETYTFDEDGEPVFDAESIAAVADTTATASSVIATKDLAGVVYDTRLSFEFTERELSCMEAWSTNKIANNILGSVTTLTAEESTEAASIYSDILTYVSTSTLQFINGDLDVNDDAVWEEYVANVEAMDLDSLTEIVQTAYDRAHS